MNELKTTIFLIFISIATIFIQTTLLSPTWNSHLYPDLNLILIIYLGMARNIPAAFPLVIFNGLLMDIMAGGMLGIHTVSRLISYLLIRKSADKVNYESFLLRFITFFVGTISIWLIAIVFAKIALSNAYRIEPQVIINQATINTVLGLFVTYPLFKVAHATVQK